MTDRLKYVIIDAAQGKVVYMFPSFIEHVVFAGNAMGPSDAVVSAGTISQSEGMPIRIRSGSVSLAIKADPQRDIADTRVILHHLGWSQAGIRGAVSVLERQLFSAK